MLRQEQSDPTDFAKKCQSSKLWNLLRSPLKTQAKAFTGVHLITAISPSRAEKVPLWVCNNLITVEQWLSFSVHVGPYCPCRVIANFWGVLLLYCLDNQSTCRFFKVAILCLILTCQRALTHTPVVRCDHLRALEFCQSSSKHVADRVMILGRPHQCVEASHTLSPLW